MGSTPIQPIWVTAPNDSFARRKQAWDHEEDEQPPQPEPAGCGCFAWLWLAVVGWQPKGWFCYYPPLGRGRGGLVS